MFRAACGWKSLPTSVIVIYLALLGRWSVRGTEPRFHGSNNIYDEQN